MSSNLKLDTRLINLYSKNATSIDNYPLMSRATFAFSSILKEEPDIVYCEIGVLNAQIPVSFYVINIYNNVLKYKIGAGATETITIAEGNYTSSTLITALKAGFSANGETNINITISKVNGKLTFTNTVNNFTIVSSGSTMMDVLGFISTQDYTSASLSLTPPYPLNLLGIQRIKVNSNYLATNTTNSFTKGISNTFASIPVNAPSFGLINYTNLNAYSLLRAKTISTIDIELRDENDNAIDFNGVDWTMTLQLNIYRLNQYSDNQMILTPILRELQNIHTGLANQPQGSTDLANQPQESTDLGIMEQPQENQPQDLGNIEPTPQNVDVPLPTDDLGNDLDFLIYQGAFP